MSKTLNVRQKQKSDLAASWTTNNPILLSGEIGVESDTGNIKVGDGATAWNDLAYVYKKQLNTEELAVIENYRTWYNETYKPQAYQAKLDYLVGEAELKKSSPNSTWMSDYRFGDGQELFLLKWNLDEELRSKAKEVEQVLSVLPRNIANDFEIETEGIKFVYFDPRFYAMVNPILEAMEIGQELDTLNIKVGDGVTAWNDLPYYYEYDATSTEGEGTEEETTTEEGTTT